MVDILEAASQICGRFVGGSVAFEMVHVRNGEVAFELVRNRVRKPEPSALPHEMEVGSCEMMLVEEVRNQFVSGKNVHHFRGQQQVW